MRCHVWSVGLLSALALCTAALLGCESGGCRGAAGASDVCPPPVYGYAQVRGRALRSDGSPVAHKDAYVSCGDVVGASSDATDAAGHFDVRLAYAVFDTILYPFPTRAPDGSFALECIGHVAINSRVTVVKNPIVVTFVAARDDVVPIETEWREGEQ